MVDNSPSLPGTVCRLLKRITIQASRIRRRSNKISPDSNILYYYRKNKDTNKMERKRSLHFIQSLSVDRLLRDFSSLMSFDLSSEVNRYIVWKILPNLLTGRDVRVNKKFCAIALDFLIKHFEAFSNMKRNSSAVPHYVIKTSEGLLLEVPTCFPKVLAHTLKWPTKVVYL